MNSPAKVEERRQQQQRQRQEDVEEEVEGSYLKELELLEEEQLEISQKLEELEQLELSQQTARDDEEEDGGYRPPSSSVDSAEAPMPPRQVGRSRKQSFLGGEEPEERTEERPPLFEFQLSNHAQLQIFDHEVTAIRDTVRLARLGGVGVSDLARLFGADATTMTLNEFAAALRGFNYADRCSAEEYEFVEAMFCGVFHAIEGTPLSTCTPLCLLCILT